MPDLIRVSRANDKSLYQIFSTLSKNLNGTEFSVDHIGGSNFNALNDAAPPKYSVTGHTIKKISLTVSDGSNIIFCRGVYDPSQVINNQPKEPNRSKFTLYRLPSSYFDEIFLENNLPDLKSTQIFDTAISPISSVARDDSESKDPLGTIVASQIEQLRQLALEFSQRQLEAEDRLEKAFKKREDTLQKRILNEEERLAQKSSNDESALREEKINIEKWRKEINDREPQHERRRLREILTETIQENLKKSALPSRNEERSTAFFYLVFGAFLIFLSFLLTFFYSSPTPDASFWLRSSKSVLAGVGGAAFIWAGLSYLKSAAISARKFEEGALRYRFDMDRASWVVETILQMNAFEAREIPPQWLEAACNDLFKAPSEDASGVTSLEAISALFDATAKARIGTNGVEFEVDRKGAKKLAEG